MHLTLLMLQIRCVVVLLREYYTSMMNDFHSLFVSMCPMP
jgi:hypothetical protein